MQSESREEYERLWNKLRDDYEPDGETEELEAERITLCWWRLKRAHRYENAQVRLAIRQGDHKIQALWCSPRNQEAEEVILRQQDALQELEVADQVSEELKQKVLAPPPKFSSLWSQVLSMSGELLSKLSLSEFFKQQGSDSERANLQARAVAIILLFEEMRHHRNESYSEVTFAQHFIPDGDQVEKLLRYETATERSLDRALNRLERLQRRRLGEPGLPAMRPHITQ